MASVRTYSATSLLLFSLVLSALPAVAERQSVKQLTLERDTTGSSFLEARRTEQGNLYAEGLWVTEVPRLQSASANIGLRNQAQANQTTTEMSIPVFALLLGGILMLLGYKVSGIISMYFGAQSGFSLFMKIILSDIEVSRELGLVGIPAAFLVTAAQQLVTFVSLLVGMAFLYCTPWAYTPKKISTTHERVQVLCFAVAFAVNIGLNNFSLALMPVSLNLVIRSCTPLVTLAVQIVLARLQDAHPHQIKMSEVCLMVLGVACAAMAIMAKAEGSQADDRDSQNLLLGVVACVISVLACALNMVLAAALGGSMELNPIDAALYMAIPSMLALMPPSFFVSHPVGWSGYVRATDIAVFMKILSLHPQALFNVFLSGLFATCYNMFQYYLVNALSATHTAFCGNFNKAATVVLSLVVGLESLPRGPWKLVMLAAVGGNIGAFAGYSALKAHEKAVKEVSKASRLATDRGS